MIKFMGMLVDRDGQTFRVIDQDPTSTRIYRLRSLDGRRLIGLYEDDLIRHAYHSQPQRRAA